mgnify:FL=1
MSYRENLLTRNKDMVSKVEEFLKNKGLKSVLDSQQVVQNTLSYIQLLLRGAEEKDREEYKLIKKYLKTLLSNKCDPAIQTLLEKIEDVSDRKFDYIRDRQVLTTHRVINLKITGEILQGSVQRDLLTAKILNESIKLIEKSFKEAELEIKDLSVNEGAYEAWKIEIKYYEKEADASTRFYKNKQVELDGLRATLNKREKYLSR